MSFNYLNIIYLIIFTILFNLGSIIFIEDALYWSAIFLFLFEIIYIFISLFKGISIKIDFEENKLYFISFFSKKILNFKDINSYKKTLCYYKIYSSEHKLIFKINRLYTAYFKNDKFSFEDILKNDINLNQYKNEFKEIFKNKFEDDFNIILFRTINILLLTFNAIIIYIKDCWILYGVNVNFKM